MAWTNLFTIGSTDFTQFEQIDMHQVNRVDVYETWTDANWTDHRVIARTRIGGTVVLSFSRASDYNAFITLLTSARNAEGYYPISVYCSNTGTTETLNAFLDVTGATAWDVTVPIKHQTVTVTITGR